MDAATSNIHLNVKTVKDEDLQIVAPAVIALGGDPEGWKPSVRYGCPLCGSSDGVGVGLGDNGRPVVHCFAGKCDVWDWLKAHGAIGNGRTEWTEADKARFRVAREQADKEAIAKAQARVRRAQKRNRKPDKYLAARGINFVPRSSYLTEEDGKVGALFPIVKLTPEKEAVVVGCHIVWLNDTLDGKADVEIQKQSFGRKGDGFVRAGKFSDAKPLIIAEGPETMLSAVQLAGGTAKVSGIAACGCLSTLSRLPKGSEVIIARDRRKPGKETDCLGVARDLAGRIKQKRPGLRVRIVKTPKNEWNDWNDVLQEAEDPQAVWDKALERAEEVAGPPDPFAWADKYTISEEGMKRILEAKMALERLIPDAQSIVFIAPPGSGKTTLLEWVAKALVAEGYKTMYVNADLPASDALRAIRQAQRDGYLLVLPDFGGDGSKSMKDVVLDLEALAKSDLDLNGQALLFTNLKKMTDVINKTLAKKLYETFRKLTAKGMTVIVEGHTNKYPGPDGELVHEGTGDLKADFDNMCYLYSTTHEDRSLTVSIVPDTKIRAPLEKLTFTVKDRVLTWCDGYVDITEIEAKREQRKKDQLVIEVITETLRRKKGKTAIESRIAKECHERGGYAENRVRAVLNRYIGDLWDCEQLRERNAKAYTLR